jgi:uncharacterized UPF0160 family protein
VNTSTGPVLATHSGKFHCDEVFAYAVLRLALGLREPGADHTLLRTRKPDLIASANIVWDVGTQYDPATQRFDHHQRGAPLRQDGTPFSSAGLVWQVYGERAVAALLPPEAAGFALAIATELDTKLVRRIDELDNGVSVTGPMIDDNLSLAALVGDFNPPWDDPASTGPTAGDAAFLQATTFVEGVLRRRVEGLRARHAAEAFVLAAHRAGEDPRILVLDRGMPWKSTVFAHDLPVLFTVSPASNGNWMLDTMPPEPGSFAQRLPLPEAWAGLQEEDLARESGVPDAVFVHLRRFVGAARTKEGAVAMAKKAMGAG